MGAEFQGTLEYRSWGSPSLNITSESSQIGASLYVLPYCYHGPNIPTLSMDAKGISEAIRKKKRKKLDSDDMPSEDREDYDFYDDEEQYDNFLAPFIDESEIKDPSERAGKRKKKMLTFMLSRMRRERDED